MPGPLSQLQRYVPPRIEPQPPGPVAAPSRFLEQSGPVIAPVEAPVMGPPVPREIAMAPLELPVNPDGTTPDTSGFASIFEDIAQNNMDATPDKNRGFWGKLGRALERVQPMLTGGIQGMGIGASSPNAASAFSGGFEQSAIITPAQQEQMRQAQEKHEADLRKSEYDIEKTLAEIEGKRADTERTKKETAWVDRDFESKLNTASSNAELAMARAAESQARTTTENKMRNPVFREKMAKAGLTEQQLVQIEMKNELTKELRKLGFGTIEAEKKAAEIARIKALTEFQNVRTDYWPQEIAVKRQREDRLARFGDMREAMNAVDMIRKLEELEGGGQNDSTLRFLVSQLQDSSYDELGRPAPDRLKQTKQALSELFPAYREKIESYGGQ